jgi:hypothetical protein
MRVKMPTFFGLPDASRAGVCLEADVAAAFCFGFFFA